MNNKIIRIIKANSEHEKEFNNLWRLYCGSNFSETIAITTWEKILDDHNKINALVAIIDNVIVGFVTYVEHECTWEIKPVCYIEDLYVSKLYRGDTYGIGTLFANELISRLNNNEWSRVYGITKFDNVMAQRLYNKFTKSELYFKYTITHKR